MINLVCYTYLVNAIFDDKIGVGGIQVISQIFIGTPLFGRIIYQDI